jgi:hypothetical protein
MNLFRWNLEGNVLHMLQKILHFILIVWLCSCLLLFISSNCTFYTLHVQNHAHLHFNCCNRVESNHTFMYVQQIAVLLHLLQRFFDHSKSVAKIQFRESESTLLFHLNHSLTTTSQLMAQDSRLHA